MKRMIYADNAATTKLDPLVFEAMRPYFIEEYANPSQPYSFARRVKLALKTAREKISACIGADPEEIYFTSGGTESNNWVIKGITDADSVNRSILTTAFEHHAVLNACHAIEQKGHSVFYLSPNSSGHIEKEDLLQAMASKSVMLVSIMMVNNELGTIQDIAELAKIAHAYGALFHTDAVQAMGHINVNVRDLQLDFLSASAHKFNGPKGIGFLYINKNTVNRNIFSPLHNGGKQESGMRAGTEDVASIVGMAAALEMNCKNLLKNNQHILHLNEELIAGLKVAGVKFRINGKMPKVNNILSLAFAGIEGETILHRLDLMGILVSTGSACDSNKTQVSHVLQAINLPNYIARSTIRISFSKDNTEEEVRDMVQALKKICG